MLANQVLFIICTIITILSLISLILIIIMILLDNKLEALETERRKNILKYKKELNGEDNE